MIGERYSFHFVDSKLVEKILEDNHAAINHVVLPTGDALPEHTTNSNVYLILTRGAATIRLADEPEEVHPAGSVVNIPHRTLMNLSNRGESPLEFFIVKAPSPKSMQ